MAFLASLEKASSSVFESEFLRATAFLKSLSLYVVILYGSKPKTFLSLNPSAMVYLCSSSPKTVAVVGEIFHIENKELNKIYYGKSV